VASRHQRGSNSGSRPGDLLRRRPFGHVLTRAQGARCQDLGRLHQYRHGARRLRQAGLANLPGIGRRGPTRSGHALRQLSSRPPVNGTDIDKGRFSAWQFARSSAAACMGACCASGDCRGVAGVLESCRYPHHMEEVARYLQARCSDAGRGRSAAIRLGGGEARPLGLGTRGRVGIECGADLGDSEAEYRSAAHMAGSNRTASCSWGQARKPEHRALRGILSVPDRFAELGPAI